LNFAMHRFTLGRLNCMRIREAVAPVLGIAQSAQSSGPTVMTLYTRLLY